MKPAEIAPLLGMKATAVAQLTFRAREGLREAWIQAHLRSVADGSDCQWTIEHLGAYSRANISRRDRAKVEVAPRRAARAARSSRARPRRSRAASPSSCSRSPSAPSARRATSRPPGRRVPLVALAAMPSAVMQGAVTVLPPCPTSARSPWAQRRGRRRGAGAGDGAAGQREPPVRGSAAGRSRRPPEPARWQRPDRRQRRARWPREPRSAGRRQRRPRQPVGRRRDGRDRGALAAGGISSGVGAMAGLAARGPVVGRRHRRRGRHGHHRSRTLPTGRASVLRRRSSRTRSPPTDPRPRRTRPTSRQSARTAARRRPDR